MLSIFELSAALLTLSAVLGWLNRRYLPLPHAIGLLMMSVLASLILIIVDLALPDRHLFDGLTNGLRQIDFADVVMNGMLAFLLFAGSLHVDLARLRSRAAAVGVLAVFGTLFSTALVGAAIWQAGQLIGHPLPPLWALVFGALVSPTDPVAVMGALRNVDVPASVEVEMQGESLFNDGVGVVLYTILVMFATGAGGEHTTTSEITKLLLLETFGSLALGVVTGYVAYLAMRAIDDYPVEVLITLALVTGTYALAQRLHMSGPLAVVAAGLFVGHRAPQDAMSERTQSYVFSLWTLIDEILNSVLFLLIGLEVLLLQFDSGALLLAAVAVPIVLAARFASIGLPAILSWSSELLPVRNVPFLTWAGVRGGISVALALSLPEDPAKPSILVATYVVVLFSIIAQGSTLAFVAERTLTPRAQKT